jgi:hypothetical protein
LLIGSLRDNYKLYKQILAFKDLCNYSLLLLG